MSREETPSYGQCQGIYINIFEQLLSSHRDNHGQHVYTDVRRLISTVMLETGQCDNFMDFGSVRREYKRNLGSWNGDALERVCKNESLPLDMERIECAADSLHELTEIRVRNGLSRWNYFVSKLSAIRIKKFQHMGIYS
jgi:hypothetical protein